MAIMIPPRPNEYFGFGQQSGRNLRDALLLQSRQRQQEEAKKAAEKTAALPGPLTEKSTSGALPNVRRTSDLLRTSADRLSDPALFEPETSKKEGDDGKIRVSMSYDTDKIYSAVRDFAGNYNEALKSAENSPISNVREKADAMSYLTTKNANALNRVGIEVAKDGTLSVNEDRFRNADMAKVQSLFEGAGSYGETVSARAGMIDSQAAMEDAKMRIYTADGSASSFTSGSIFDDRF